MKKGYILFLAALCLAGCGKKKAPTDVTISGAIKGLGTDTLYLYGMDETRDSVIDTIPVRDDKFRYTLKVDTLTPLYLLIRDQVEYPLYLDKGNHVRVQGDTARLWTLDIDGNSWNEELTAFQKEILPLDSLPPTDRERAVEARVDSFIARHPSSLVGLYLLDKYFVQKDTPNFAHIKQLTQTMTGVLHDKLYMDQLTNDIAQQEKTQVGKYAPYFNLPDAKGEKINRSSEALKQKNLLVCFWASWDDSLANARANGELRALYKKYKKDKHFALLGISLDIDKRQWAETVKRDTLDWIQLCDFGGMNSDIAKQYAINHLPANLLLSPEGRIIGKNLRGEELAKQVKEAITASEEKEKAEKARKLRARR
ncbi:MAG: DUF4369 domain-containing protein [Mediterranea sp.]|jgi:peroxiredoxin|nr:DUF4369 domain-containing protein [Mediterranea sp.]